MHVILDNFLKMIRPINIIFCDLGIQNCTTPSGRKVKSPEEEEQNENFRSHQWGPCSPVSVHVAFKHLHQPVKSHLQSFRTLRGIVHECSYH